MRTSSAITIKSAFLALLLACAGASSPLLASESWRAPKITAEEAEEYLQDEGIEVNASNMINILLSAHVEAVVSMLAMGLDPNAKPSSFPQTFLEFAAMACADKKNDTRRIVQTVDALLEYGANPNNEGMRDLGPMLTAAQQCPGVVVERLVKAKGNINASNSLGHTPLSMALIVKNYDAAETLVRLGARLKPESGKKILDGQESDTRLKALIKRATSP